MQVEVLEDKKLVCLWLTRAESADTGLRERLKPLCEKYREKKYMVAVYRSGDQELRDVTGALLRHNRKLMAEREVQAEKDHNCAFLSRKCFCLLSNRFDGFWTGRQHSRLCINWQGLQILSRKTN